MSERLAAFGIDMFTVAINAYTTVESLGMALYRLVVGG